MAVRGWFPYDRRGPGGIREEGGAMFGSISYAVHTMPRAGSPRIRWAAAALVGVLVLMPARAAAQATMSGELAVFGANALIGGATSGIVAWLRGESFTEAFGGGALGGSAMYAGKRLASVDAPGAGLVGRLVSAAGSSVVRNGAAGRGAFDRLILPVGPVTLYWTTPRDSADVSAKLDLGRSIFLGFLAFDDGLELDWGATASAGAPVFRSPGRAIEGEAGGVGGVELLGAIVLSDPAVLSTPVRVPLVDPERIAAHERVHVLQDDFLSIAWADPIEDWLLGRLPGGDVARRYVDVGGVYVAFGVLLMTALPYEDRPWEDEAHYVGGTR